MRLIEVNRERFAKTIRAGPSADGRLLLAPDSGDELARARRLLTDWLPIEPGIHAVLARTNIELAPFAAVALELGIPYRAAEDGLELDDSRWTSCLHRCASIARRRSLWPETRAPPGGSAGLVGRVSNGRRPA